MFRVRMFLLFLLSLCIFGAFIYYVPPQSFLAIFIAVLLFSSLVFFFVSLVVHKLFWGFILSFSLSAFLLMHVIDALNLINTIIIVLLTGSIVALADRVKI